MMGKEMEETSKMDGKMAMESKIKREQIESIEFGEFEDYYLAGKKHTGQRQEWEDSREEFDALVADLAEFVQVSDGVIGDIIENMRRIENKWGDCPQTRKIARIVGLEKVC
ncbi:hypothetical protein L0244_08545 [bacterium]|nr:hypothetical protein [bacterium]